jgi:hypothetical protein
MNLYYDLLKEWCDSLVSLQLTQFSSKELYGGIMCPSCGRIHGRCGDAIYPMMYLAKSTGEEKYLRCAERLFNWTEYNMVRPDGSYNNDTNSEWKGITVFAVTQLGEALLHYGNLLGNHTRERFMSRFCMSADYLFHNIEEIGGNINYPVTCAHTMAVAAKITGEIRYSRKARELATLAMQYIGEDGLLYGEGRNRDEVSPKGCYPVDLGYNVEESLPALLLYAVLQEDNEVYNCVIRAIKVHLEFMLPDGAWDNSWGTRSYKWSYWGSRTSDGCQSGFGLAVNQIPELRQAVYRNTLLLKACTHDGLLYGGPLFYSAKEPPCVHHTFCHAKALATLLAQDYPLSEVNNHDAIKLPRELQKGILTFPSIHVNLLALGGWRGTVSDYDVEYSEEGHPTGGALTLLWNDLVGLIFAGTMTRYYLVEPNNMQIPLHTKDICLTPRLTATENGKVLESCNDKTAVVCCLDKEEYLLVRADGMLKDGKQNGTYGYHMEYQIEDDRFLIRVISYDVPVNFNFPVISGSDEYAALEASHRQICIQRNDRSLLVTSSHPINIKNNYPKRNFSQSQEEVVEEKVIADGKRNTNQINSRVFNPVSGMEAVPCYLKLKAGETAEIIIKIV